MAPRPRVTLNLETFQLLGKNNRLHKFQELNEEARESLLAKLDPVERGVFEGLHRLTERAAKTHEVEKPAEEIPPPVPAVGAFDLVRRIMQAVSLSDYETGYRLTRELLAKRDLLFKARSLLVPVGQEMARLYRHQLGDEELEAGEPQEIVYKINERLSDVLAYAGNDDDALASSDFDVIEQTSVELPQEVEEPVLIERVTLLVKPDRALRKDSGVRPLASGIYLIEATLIGVSSSLAPEAREGEANAFALQTLGANVTPVFLTRPDSDGIWFPVFRQRFVAEILQFPDQSRRYYGASTAISEVQATQLQAKLLRMRTQRGQFERQNAELLAELTEAERQYDDASTEARGLSEVYLVKYGARWQTTAEVALRSRRKDLEYDLNHAGDNLPRRDELRQRYAAVERQLLTEQARIVSLRVQVRHTKKEIERLRAELERRKRYALNPYAELGERIAARV